MLPLSQQLPHMPLHYVKVAAQKKNFVVLLVKQSDTQLRSNPVSGSLRYRLVVCSCISQNTCFDDTKFNRCGKKGMENKCNEM
jgi:hypothetical protein